LNLRERFERLCPGQFFLDSRDRSSIETWLKDRGWIGAGRQVIAADRAGEGNMNCTLRIRTTEGAVILKQARPWVEKYPDIAAPKERAIVEAAFYEETASSPIVSAMMPRLLGSAPAARILMLEDLSPASDFTSVYGDAAIGDEELRALSAWLRALHTGFRDLRLCERFANMAMRELNHLHIFDFPLRHGNGLKLDDWTPGLANGAAMLQNDVRYRDRVHELGQMYLGPGECLVHGDFFPGSWMRARGATWVIDPEICFWGVPEFDAGVMMAHLMLARAPAEKLELFAALYPVTKPALARAYAGVEIMRRLIGVAQLPLAYGLADKARLLERSREMVMAL